MKSLIIEGHLYIVETEGDCGHEWLEVDDTRLCDLLGEFLWQQGLLGSKDVSEWNDVGRVGIRIDLLETE